MIEGCARRLFDDPAALGGQPAYVRLRGYNTPEINIPVS